MITTREQILYTYIKNDKGILLETYFNKAVELGLHDLLIHKSHTEYLEEDSDLVACMGLNVLQLQDVEYLKRGLEDYKELTLSDFNVPTPIDNKGFLLTEKEMNIVHETLSDLLCHGSAHKAIHDNVIKDLVKRMGIKWRDNYVNGTTYEL